jgi:predicted ATPase/DNA-binding SARP family transcriptional activator
MEFRILGPLEVVSDDGPLDVPGGKPRALLALLLVHANRVVPQDRLLEDLWEGSPPQSRAATLRPYVHQLRRALQVDSLRTRSGGYVLEVKDSEVDALRFERTVNEVSQVGDASPRWVSLRLGEALAWWRGQALAGFEDTAWARAEAARLNELRLGAVADVIDARLRLGEHAMLVPELESLVSEHPLRERLWAQLMLALYLCDRQAEALRAYQRVRTMLVEELGVEPCAELVGLELRILDHDETLVAPPESVGAVTVMDVDAAEPGVGLPSPPTSFVGRDTEVDEVSQLVEGHRLVTLSGAGGCGKTRLAVEVARRLAGGFADGVRFADLAAITDQAHVADAVAGALGLAQEPTSVDPVGRVARYLGERSMLCVLDNCEHLLDACAALAEAIVSRDGVSRLLATSREPLAVVGEQVYVVPSLDVDTEAVGLFADRAGEARAAFEVDDANRATIAEICRRLDGIPLAIELAAARMSHMSPAQVLERLDGRFTLLAGARRIPRHQTLRATFDWSYDLLGAREQELLCRLATFPVSFSLEAAQAVAGGEDVLDALASLVAKSLVQIVDAGERLRYRLLEAVRLYAHERLGADDVEACRARHHDWVVGWLESIPLEERLLGDLDPLFVTEFANVRAAVEWSQAHGDPEAVARIAAGTDWLLGEYPVEATGWCEGAAAAGEALPPDLQVQLYVLLFRLGVVGVGGFADWVRVADWAERAAVAAGDKFSPLRAYAAGHRWGAAAVEARERRDESLARWATGVAEATVAMSQQFSVPWRMYCRLHAGYAYSTLALAWPRHAEAAQRHYAAGFAEAAPAPPYLGLHAQLAAQLALHRFLAGDTNDACTLARQAQGDIALSRYFQLEGPLTLALIVGLASASDASALRAELRAYHEAARRRDRGSRADETLVLYGGILAAVSEDWELACRLLAAGQLTGYASPAMGHLYVHFRDQVRGVLGSERSRQLRNEGRAMPLADALAAALS